ncbi:MAG: hypothetical protein ACK50M_16040 [Cyclobacteriaceae bacterium]
MSTKLTQLPATPEYMQFLIFYTPHHPLIYLYPPTMVGYVQENLFLILAGSLVGW